MEEQILKLLEEKSFRELRETLNEIEPADLAILFEELPKERLGILFRLLAKELAAEVFVELSSDAQELLIVGFSDNELEEVLEELYVDDTVDIIEEMPANVVKRILKHSEADMRQWINNILKYPKDSAGSIMTVEYVDLKENMTVEDAFLHIRRTGVDKETVYTCYVTDSNRKLVGLVSVKDLLLADYSCTIEEVMETNVIFANTLEDKEDVSRQFTKYDFLALPVVDQEGRLVGIITVDDVLDVLEEENTEDIEKMAAIVPSDKPYLKTGVIETWKQRFPWLFFLMISATFTSAIINRYNAALDGMTVLTAFIPMLMGSGGNAGGQSSVTIIRGISLGEIEFSDMFRVIWKELRVACLCGITLAIANFAKLIFLEHISVPVALVVSLTLVVTIFCAKIVGCSLPMVAKKIGFDPAVMASPFITTVIDALSLVIYFNIAVWILGI
ncbi:MAG: magnesium transporter [Ruminococcaceae bacterium]|nr:magnesium transporter [Oscillospiraceae bacterium]